MYIHTITFQSHLKPIPIQPSWSSTQFVESATRKSCRLALWPSDPSKVHNERKRWVLDLQRRWQYWSCSPISWCGSAGPWCGKTWPTCLWIYNFDMEIIRFLSVSKKGTQGWSTVLVADAPQVGRIQEILWLVVIFLRIHHGILNQLHLSKSLCWRNKGTTEGILSTSFVSAKRKTNECHYRLHFHFN